MRKYWMKILLGAFGIFVVGMIGVSLVRGGIAKVHEVVEGDGPITIPLGLVPFVLSGERLGNLSKVTLIRDSPSRVSEVALEVNLTDSLLSRGLEGCRLVANFGSDSADPGLTVRAGRRGEKDVFFCLPGDSVPEGLVEYGVATFQPEDVEVPLFLPAEVVAEIQQLDFADDSTALGADSTPVVRASQTDSIRAELMRQVEPYRTGEGRRADSVRPSARRFADSIRAEARKRIAEISEEQ